MTPKEFIELGGTIIVTHTKKGYYVSAEYENKSLCRIYSGGVSHEASVLDHSLELSVMQTAVNECLYSRANHLRMQRISDTRLYGIDFPAPNDIFTGHPGLNKID